MDYGYYTAPKHVDVIRANKAILDNATITKANAKKGSFMALVLVYLIGALGFAIALAYNNFAQAIINHYTKGKNNITGTLINLSFFLAFSIGLLYLIWWKNPSLVSGVLNP